MLALNIDKSFSFLIQCNIYAKEIDSISLCDGKSTKANLFFMNNLGKYTE